MNTSTMLASAKTPGLGEIVDLDRYPIDKPHKTKIQAVIEACRDRLDYDGCALIRDFIRPESLERMRAESDRLYNQTYWSEASHNPYFTTEDTTLPPNHPKRFFEQRNSGYINSDILEPDSDLRAIYTSEIVTQFIGKCLGVSPLYTWADPLGCNPYSVMDENHYFPWHFDGNDFTVSILVQEAESGGTFEYAADLRSRETENFDGVASVLAGDRTRVKQLDLKPGDMQIFKGRFSMHRVTRVIGKARRVIALPTYVTDPHSVNRPEHSKHLYGRALPIHYERESHRPDALTD